jgi:hypothetical protein
VNNIADDPAYAEELDRLSAALDEWLERTDDQGLDPEDEMAERMWPDGEQPTTAPPEFLPNAPSNRAREPAPDGGAFESPAQLILQSTTQGASIVYATGPEAPDETGWSIYGGPIDLPVGETTVYAKAVRYGYEESPVQAATFDVRKTR